MHAPKWPFKRQKDDMKSKYVICGVTAYCVGMKEILYHIRNFSANVMVIELNYSQVVAEQQPIRNK